MRKPLHVSRIDLSCLCLIGVLASHAVVAQSHATASSIAEDLDVEAARRLSPRGASAVLRSW